MYISTKKLNRSLNYFIDGRNYQYNPSQFMFDIESDPDYVYVAVDAVYIIRVKKTDFPQILSAGDKSPMIKTDLKLERLIEQTAQDAINDVVIVGEKLIGEKNKRVICFEPENGKFKQTIWIDARFFEKYYNQPITKYGVPDNITFTANTKDKKSPIIMWQDDEAIALFLPISHN